MTALTKVETVLPAELAGLANDLGGLVQVRAELLKPLRLKLVQAMSQSQGTLGNIGEFICESAGINFGDKITIIPLMIKESASLMYSVNKPPRTMPVGEVPDDGTPICHTKDLIKNVNGILCKQCPYSECWSEWIDDKAPQCKVSIDVFCIPEGTKSVMLLQLRKTSYAAGKDLVNKVVSSGAAPFLFKYTLASRLDTSDKYKYQIVDSAATVKQPLTKEELESYAGVIKDFLQKQKDKAIEYDVTEEVKDDIPL